MGGARRDAPLPRIAKNTILRDRVNDEQVRIAKEGPQMIKNPRQRTNEERSSLLTGD
jgi:hypothetical protein